MRANGLRTAAGPVQKTRRNVKCTEVHRNAKIPGRAAATNVLVRSTPLKKTGGAYGMLPLSAWLAVRCYVLPSLVMVLSRCLFVDRDVSVKSQRI